MRDTVYHRRSRTRTAVVLRCMLVALSFALWVAPFGMVRAAMSPTIASRLADIKTGILGASLGASLTLIAYIVFRLGPGLVLEPFRWPFQCLSSTTLS